MTLIRVTRTIQTLSLTVLAQLLLCAPSAPAEKTAGAARPLHVDDLAAQCVESTKPKKRKAATYPRSALGTNRAGFVLLEVVVNEKGRVGEVEVVNSPYAEFSTEAIEAAKKWRFEPAMCDGKPISVRQALTFVFNP